VSLSAAKLRLIVNQLADPGTAHAAAHVLAVEAKERNVLVADLVAQALAPPQASSSTPPPTFSDIDSDRIDVAVGKRINFNVYGLRTEVLAETEKAWRMRTPAGGETWLPKSQVEHHGEDAVGRAILVLPMWLARKKGFL
jgi:SH3-like domain-containing protein